MARGISLISQPASLPSTRPHAAPRRRASRRSRSGFTLVEILIVVVILGILAAIVIPQFTNANTDSKVSSVRSSLQTVRSQLTLFRAQHAGTAVQITGMWGLLTGKSDTTETDVAVGTGSAFGPYLSVAPTNPLNGLSSVTSNDPDTAAGWYYTATGADSTFLARDSAGNAISTW